MNFGMKINLVIHSWLLTTHCLLADTPQLTIDNIFTITNKPVIVNFQEKKTFSILERTLIINGQLQYIPPQTLIRYEDNSQQMSYHIEANKVSIWQGNKIQRQMNLAYLPELAEFANTLRALLAGDVSFLEQIYTLTLNGTFINWQLELKPKSIHLGQIISKVRLTGKEKKIRSVETIEYNGNNSYLVLLSDAK